MSAGVVPFVDVCKSLYADMTRADLARLFAQLGYTRGAEIGVERGLFSEALLEANPQLTLLCVDAWQAYRGYREHVSQDKLDAFYDETRQRLLRFVGRCQVIRKFSVEAAKDVRDGSLDFVYIDGNHTYPEVNRDINAWSPKVRPGGIVAGHDYCRRKHMDYGVVEAVQEQAKARDVPWIVIRGDSSPSWVWVQR